MATENLDPVVENQDPKVVIDSGEKPEEKSGGWYEALGPDLGKNPSIQKFKDPASLAKSYIELQKLVGKDKVVVPTEKSTPAEWAEFYRKVGRPDALDGYETPELGVPEEVKMRDEQLAAFKEKALELGLSKKQFAELYKMQQEMSAQSLGTQVEEYKSLKDKAETELRKEWGQAYDAKVDKAQQVVNTYFKGKGLNKAFEILANDKGFIAAMASIGEKLGESAVGGGEARGTLTPDEAQKEVNELIADGSGPLFNSIDPRHEQTKQRYYDLLAMMGN
jgi:hypothetical protein